MIQVANLQARFQWGLLLVTDDSSHEIVPPPATADEQITAIRTTLLIRVRHADEGFVSVRVLSRSEEAAGALAFTGEIHLDSSTLRVSDVVGTHAVTIPMAEGTHPIAVYVDSAVEATRVDIVII